MSRDSPPLGTFRNKNWNADQFRPGAQVGLIPTGGYPYLLRIVETIR